MFVEPSERSLSWPTVHLIEALGSIPIEEISVLPRSTTIYKSQRLIDSDSLN